MKPKAVKEFLAINPSDNLDFAQQLILENYEKRAINELYHQFVTLNEVMYKSYLKDLTISELVEIFKNCKLLYK